MTATELSAIVGVVLSLIFSYIPGVKNWFDSLESSHKQAVMGFVLVIVSLSIFGLACSGVIDVVECTQVGALGLIEVLIAALVANQATYLITKKPTRLESENEFLRGQVEELRQR